MSRRFCAEESSESLTSFVEGDSESSAEEDQLDLEPHKVKITKQEEDIGNTLISGLSKMRRQLLESIEAELMSEAQEKPDMQAAKHLVNPITFGVDPKDYEFLFGEIDMSSDENILKVWRIERFEPVEWSESKFGKFHTSDCYLVLNITDSSEKKIMHIHHWIGQQSTPDKYGAVAIRAVELNTYLGGSCRIFREMESLESKAFLDYFGSSLEYLFGGTESAFTHVSPPEWPTLLYECMQESDGHVLMKLVASNANQFHDDGAFLLDAGDYILPWIGWKCSSSLAYGIIQYANILNQQDRSFRARIVVLKDRERSLSENTYFWNMLWSRLGGSYQPSETPPTVLLATDVHQIWVDSSHDDDDDDEDDEEEEEEEEREEPRPLLDSLLQPKREQRQHLIERQFIWEEDEDQELPFFVEIEGSWPTDQVKRCLPMEIDKDEGCWMLSIALPIGKWRYRYRIIYDKGEEPVIATDDIRDAVRDRITNEKWNIVTVVARRDEKFRLFGTVPSGQSYDLKPIELRNGCILYGQMLESQHCYLLDCESELFIWQGKRANDFEKEISEALAKKFFQLERPDYSRLVLLHEGGENSSFIAKFRRWFSRSTMVRLCSPRLSNLATTNTPVSIECVMDQSLLDGIIAGQKNAKMSTELVESEEVLHASAGNIVGVYVYPQLESLGPELYGVFYQSNCYILLYRYRLSSTSKRLKYLAYFWQGHFCVTATRHWAQFQLEFCKKLQVKVGANNLSTFRIYQGKESPLFFRLFGGSITLKSGCWRQLSEVENKLYSVHSPLPSLGQGVRVTQMPAVSSSLFAGHSFILRTPSECFIAPNELFEWKSKESPSWSEQVYRQAQTLSTFEIQETSLQKIYQLIKQDEEPRLVRKQRITLERRIFLCTNRGGTFAVQELVEINSCDLILFNRDIILLDLGSLLFRWIGTDASDSLCWRVSIFLESHSRNHSTCISPVEVKDVKPGSEPAEFSRELHDWIPLQPHHLDNRNDSLVVAQQRHVERLYQHDQRQFHHQKTLDRIHRKCFALLATVASFDPPPRFADPSMLDLSVAAGKIPGFDPVGLMKEALLKPSLDKQTMTVDGFLQRLNRNPYFIFINWKDVWIRDGLLPPPPQSPETVANFPPRAGQVQFLLQEHFDASAVFVDGSWDWTQPIGLRRVGTPETGGWGWIANTELPVGRYMFRYRILLNGGDQQLQTDPSLPGTDALFDGLPASILRIYHCDQLDFGPDSEISAANANETDQNSRAPESERIKAEERELRRKMREEAELRLLRKLQDKKRLRSEVGNEGSMERSTSPLSSSQARESKQSSISDGSVEEVLSLIHSISEARVQSKESIVRSSYVSSYSRDISVSEDAEKRRQRRLRDQQQREEERQREREREERDRQKKEEERAHQRLLFVGEREQRRANLRTSASDRDMNDLVSTLRSLREKKSENSSR